MPELRSEHDKEDKKYFLTERLGGAGNDMLEQLDTGARCESSDWGIPIYEYDYDTMFLAEIQSIRKPARILAVRARVQIADGKFDEAIRTLQTGYALGRHVAHGPFVIQFLVGGAIFRNHVETSGIADSGTGAPESLLGLGVAPAADGRLSAGLRGRIGEGLPRPSRTPRPGQEALSAGTVAATPGANRRSLVCVGTGGFVGQTTDRGGTPPMLHTFLDGYPDAKKYLISKGRPAAEVEAMPVPQVVLLYTMQTYDELRDDCCKCLWLPYPEALKWLEQAKKQPGDNPLASREFGHLAAYAKRLLITKRASARIDRNIAALEILEAIRLYGASHDAQLPERLSDITEVYLPSDPLRGEPFLYRREGNSAILESPYPAEPAQALRYQILFDRGDKKP